MSLPKLTVIIPTLKRPDTLSWTLKTVVDQDYPDFRIIVSDNFSNDETAAVVGSFNNEKISYINPGKKLSMSHHWEFALEHVAEGFVTILGDDDGMLPGALKRVGALLEKHHGIQAMGWRFGNFNWKGLPPYFMIPMANYYRVVDARKEMNDVFNKTIYQTITFPSLYGGFIDTALIRDLKNKFGGAFFHSRIPDFFSGALVAASVDKYIRAEFPITINATSRHSTGFATINEKNEQTAFKDLQKKEDNIPFHSNLLFIRSNAIPIAEAMLQVHELVPSFPKVNIPNLLREVVTEARTTESESKFNELIEGVRQIAAMNKIENIDSMLQGIRHEPQGHVVKKKFSPVSISLYIDTTGTGIDTVDEACRFGGDVIPRSTLVYKGSLTKQLSRLIAFKRYIYLKTFSKKSRYF
jgi:glycosyltransferase involved in cell wall biosynthesis